MKELYNIETDLSWNTFCKWVAVRIQRLKLIDANIERVKTAKGGVEGLLYYGFAEKLDFDRLTVTYNNLLVEKEKIQRTHK